MNTWIKESLPFFFLALIVAPAALAASPQKSGQAAVRYFPHQQVQSGFAKGGYLFPWGQGNFSIMTARRDHGGDSELHTRDTDVFYIVEGSATFITGGKMINPRQIGPGEMRGSGVEGGETRQLSKGDAIVIPAGIPHWFKQVSSTTLYFVVKVRQE